MAIESAAFLRRFARTECLVLLLIVCLCAAAAAQVPASPVVMPGSVVGLQHDQWGQIYHVVVSSKGDVLFLDTQNGAVYQLLPDGETVTTVSGPGEVLKGGGNFWNAGMAIDSNDTIYLTNRWDNAIHFLRVPYDPVTKTWPLSANSNWGAAVGGGSGLNTNDIAVDDNNNLVVSTETQTGIVRLSVDASGNPGTLDWVAKGLKAVATKVAVDHDGNIYFIENCWSGSRSDVAVGVWMIPAGTTGLVGDGKGSLESSGSLVRVDPPAANFNFKGITFDAAGNAYFSSQVDGYGGNYNMVLMVPKADLLSSTHTWSHAVMMAPVSATAAIAIDPRGYLWIPTPTGGWTPSGSLAIPGTLNVAKYISGSVDLGATPVGTPGSTGTVYYSFSAATTFGSLAFSQPGGGSNFAQVATNPNADPNAATPAEACKPGTQYAAGSSCPVWLALTPSIPGGVSGQLQMLGSDSKVISNSGTYLHGLGQGPEISILVSSAKTNIGAGFSSPKQVAADALGNSYVADSALGKVFQFPAGATSSTIGVSIGTGLTAPTGVAVDGSGNVYIADSGKVIEVPYQSGALNPAAQTVLQTGLGAGLNLAADGAGNVYVADPDNHRVVKVSNSATSFYLPDQTITIGSGFTQPSAVAVHGSGNLFVADGTSLYELPAIGGQTAITSQLAGSVTGLAVDASGSVYVAQSSGLIRIPVNDSGKLSLNDAVALGGDTVTTPSSVALDSVGNLFVSNGTDVSQLSINGFLDFGQVIPYVETDAEAQFFNIGNQPLTLSALANDTITGTNAEDFLMVSPGDAPACDPANPISVGAYCWLGVAVTPAAEGTRTATLTVQSNAANASSVALGLSTVAVADNRPGTTTAVTYSPSQLTYPADVTVTVTVAPVSGSVIPTGTVTVSLSGQAKVSAELQNGVATFSYKQLKGGNYRLSASYGGSGTEFAVSAGSTTFTVNRAASSTSLTIPQTYYNTNAYYVPFANSVTLTAKVTAAAGAPTGAVAFMEGGVPADPTQPSSPLDANGVATFNTSNLSQGTHTITAVYQSDINFAISTSTAVVFQVVPPKVLITAEPPTMSLTAGVPGSSMLTLTSIVRFNTGVQLACTGLPNYSECTFSDPVPAVEDGKAPVKVGVTISTNVPVNVALRSNPSPWGFASLFALGLVGVVVGKKTKYNGRALMMICALFLITAAVVGMSACSNGGYSKTPPAPHVTTPSGSYVVGIKATRPDTGELVSLPFTMNVTVQ